MLSRLLFDRLFQSENVLDETCYRKLHTITHESSKHILDFYVKSAEGKS